MSETTISPTMPELPAEVDSQIQQMFDEIDEALGQMKRDQVEIERYKSESVRIQAETKAIIASIKGMWNHV